MALRKKWYINVVYTVPMNDDEFSLKLHKLEGLFTQILYLYIHINEGNSMYTIYKYIYLSYVWDFHHIAILYCKKYSFILSSICSLSYNTKCTVLVGEMQSWTAFVHF